MAVKKNYTKKIAEAKREISKLRRSNRAKGRTAKPIEVIQDVTKYFEPEPKITPGQQKLINAAKYLVADRLELAALKPLTGKAINVRNYETLEFMSGTLTDAEKDVNASLELIGDLLTGREQFDIEEYERMCLDDEYVFGEGTSAGEADEVIKRFNKSRKFDGTYRVRYAGMKPGYNAEALMEQYRRDPQKFRLLKATSNKRFHIVLFGTLYSFVGKKQAAAAGKR